MLTLKPYQERALEALSQYARLARQMQDPDLAFYKLAKRPYRGAPAGLERVPYVCMRMPTGGGKTLVAAHSLGRIMAHYVGGETGLVAWIVPWESILRQTLAALRDKAHPYRQVLDASFSRGVRVFTLHEALFGQLAPHDLADSLCILVSTIDAFRVEDKEGRKVYEANGNLMAHFEDLPPQVEATLAHDEAGGVARSLENVIRLHNPLVVLDEGHNAQTSLSFDTLARLNPAFMLEYTATPRGQSNVLVDVPALELKQAHMVKLPLWLHNHTTWRATLQSAAEKREALEHEAERAHSKEGGDYIRPILLIQAEPRSKEDSERVTVERVRGFLCDELHIPVEQVAVKTGEQDELAGVDLLSSGCPVRHIITVYALKEGWDCSFAYVLASVANLGQRRAVEQLIGRVLRLPYARVQRAESLNYAYVYSCSPHFGAAADAVRQGLMGNGYTPEDVRPSSAERPETLSVERAVADREAAIPQLAYMRESAWEPLRREHLLAGFSLSQHSPAISFTPPDEELSAQFDVTSDDVVMSAPQQLLLPMSLHEQPLDADGLVAWLDWHLRDPRIGQADSRAYLRQVVTQLIAQHGEEYLPELARRRFHLLETLRRQIALYLEGHAYQRMQALKGAGRLASAGECCYALPESMTLEQPHRDTFSRHLFAQAAAMNAEEAAVALKLDGLGNLRWWYRNRESEDFSLQGWWGRFYPDFLALTLDGLAFILEYKGAQLESAPDAVRKEELGRIWEAVSEGQGRFWMVTAENTDATIAQVAAL